MYGIDGMREIRMHCWAKIKRIYMGTGKCIIGAFYLSSMKNLKINHDNIDY